MGSQVPGGWTEAVPDTAAEGGGKGEQKHGGTKAGGGKGAWCKWGCLQRRLL